MRTEALWCVRRDHPDALHADHLPFAHPEVSEPFNASPQPAPLVPTARQAAQ